MGQNAIPHSLRSRVAIQLACGDQVTAKNPPLSNKTVYGCEAGKGHGYSVRWVSYTNTGNDFTRENPDFRDSEG